MLRFLAILLICLGSAAIAQGQEIRVNPTGVNVNAHGSTTVFLTYASLKGYRPADACWAGELILAAPDLGTKPDPATLFGCLPARYEQTSLSAQAVFSDVMSIPASVARRAYQAAVTGVDSRFFYVRRFVSAAGGPDQYVAVTCRLTGGGARTPFSLTDVTLSFAVDTPVLLIKPGAGAPKIRAEITYTGTGRLKGRWEVVLPGEEPPSETDLLTEATLPLEERPRQRRYTQVSRFNLFLPPVGRHTLEGPDPALLPTTTEGPYLVLLRIEATDDREADSDLAAIGAGPGAVHSGAVAGFPLPPLRYFVGSDTKNSGIDTLLLLSPLDGENRAGDRVVEFSWKQASGAALYGLELADRDGRLLLQALLAPNIRVYRPPSWLVDSLSDSVLRWRVTALNDTGSVISESAWRSLSLTQPKSLARPTR